MNILFATQHPHIPQIAGGAQSSVHELVPEFLAHGHRAAMLAGLTTRGVLGFKSRVRLKLGRSLSVVDDGLGYRVHRAWDPVQAVDEVVRRVRPDVAVMQSGHPVPLARAFERAGVPCVIYLRNVELDDLGGDPSTLLGTRFVANSHFTAARYRELFGLSSTIVYPLVRAEAYRTETSRESVVFVNPHPLKGLNVALGLARACPDIPFHFVEAWTFDGDARERLLAQVAALPNVTLMPRTRDMLTVYERAKVVLAPSQWEEAFGRIAAEAHCSAIPVLASRIGGLPEAVGPGGQLVPPDAPISDWASALKAMWHDEANYARLTQAAQRHAERPALDRAQQVATLLDIFQQAIAGIPARDDRASQAA
ncbi:glycosyltransferase [Acuticoccus sp.]|uniref:glycosyltransferase n=1 Tax=Acuticoccus sp. TaxID=1904378 RepID=UPI003B52B603